MSDTPQQIAELARAWATCLKRPAPGPGSSAKEQERWAVAKRAYETAVRDPATVLALVELLRFHTRWREDSKSVMTTPLGAETPTAPRAGEGD